MEFVIDLNEWADKLYEDLCFAAPELHRLKIGKFLEDFMDALRRESGHDFGVDPDDVPVEHNRRWKPRGKP